VTSFAASSLLDRFENVPDWVRIVLFFGLWALYEPLMTTFGGTLGNRIKGIRVRQKSHPVLKISFPQAFIRYLIKACLGWLSFITINTNKEKRAIHDFVSGSVMIKVTL
jgi:uncharacterized RDD family membrane protein YckC